MRCQCSSESGCASPSLAQNSTLRIPATESHLPHSSQGQRTRALNDSSGPSVASKTLCSTDYSATSGRALASTLSQGHPVSGQRGDLPLTDVVGLASERCNLNAMGLPEQVLDTVQNARASSTRSFYSCEWQVFNKLFNARNAVPFQCSVVDLLCFLQNLVDKGKVFSTSKGVLGS